MSTPHLFHVEIPPELVEVVDYIAVDKSSGTLLIQWKKAVVLSQISTDGRPMMTGDISVCVNNLIVNVRPV